MKIWIATGGTGGHVFPAIAVANELAAMGHRITISTDGRTREMVKKNKPAKSGVAFVWAAGIGGKSKIKQMIAMFKIMASAFAYTLRFMIFRPNRVVSFGGYSSVPPVMAARIWHIPTYMHEQNAAMGRANRFAMKWVNVLMTSFPTVSGIPAGKTRVVYTGLPVRPEFKTIQKSPDAAFPRLLVTGGSLGATVLDEIVPSAVAELPASIKKKLFVVHQTRPDAVNRLRAYYEKNGIRANVLSFIHDMARQIADCDLVIGRSGASTTVELQTIGRPAIFVPLSINPDQLANAESFAKSGGGFVCIQDKFTVKWLSSTLSELFENPARLAKMADRARVPNNAVENIVHEILA